MTDKTPKPKRNWGQNQVRYLAALEDKPVKVAFLDGKMLKGILTGVDTYEIFVRVNGQEIMIAKGSIKYIHPDMTERN